MIKFVVPILTFDKEQTIDFYSKLGFVVVSKDLLLREPLIYLHLYEGTPESVAHRKEGDGLDLLFSIQVEEIAPIKQQLQTNNIPIENDYDIPVGEYLYIRDPNMGIEYVSMNYLSPNKQDEYFRCQERSIS